MEKQYIVIDEYTCENNDPIKLVRGDKVIVGERSDAQGPWPNWVYCTSCRTKKEGWIPVQILEIADGEGIVTKDYVAKEMSVNRGESLVGGIELNGWIWCRRISDGEEGWVPEQCVRELEVGQSGNIQ